MKIPVLVGPTSSGKTSAALALCKKFGASIIAADSRQTIKFMDIGTGKIPVNSGVKFSKDGDIWLLDGVKVYGYDLTDPNEYFSAYDYAVYALKTMSALIGKGERFIIVGGTGFYIDLITGRIILNSSAPDFELRTQLETESLESLLSKLESLNKEEFAQIDKSNFVRVLRAVEKNSSQKTSKPLSHINADFIFYGLDGETRENLYKRVDTWTDEVWQNGLIEETKLLLERFPKSQKLKGLVYKSVVDYINNRLGKTQAIQRTKFDLHAYIRRQLTWFRKNKGITWNDTCIINIEDIWTKKS